jgi:hypothetical protein
MQARKQPPPSHQVYVTGFSQMTNNQLRLIFIEMGFRGVVVTVNTRGQTPFAFVTFLSQEDATRALAANGCTFIEDGESFQLTVSTVREKPQFRGGEAAYADPIPAASSGGAVGGRWGNHRSQSSQSPQSQLQQPAQQPAQQRLKIAIQQLLLSWFVDESVAREFAENYVSSHAPPSGEYTEKDVRHAFEFYKRQPFIKELAKDLEKLPFVTPKSAMEFACDYARSSEHSKRLQCDFRKVDVTIAIDAFKAMVSKDVYTFIGCTQRSIASHLLPPSILRKVLQAVGPNPTGTIEVPNFFLYMIQSGKTSSDIMSLAQGHITAAIKVAVVTESGIQIDPKCPRTNQVLLFFPDFIGKAKPNPNARRIVQLDSSTYTSETVAVESGQAIAFGDLMENGTAEKLARDLNADPALMREELRHWVSAMDPIATKLNVSFPTPEPVAQAMAAVPTSSESSESYRICKHGNFLNHDSSPCRECLSNGGKDPIKDGWGDTLGYQK